MKKTIKFEFKKGFDEDYICRIVEQSHIKKEFGDDCYQIYFENIRFCSDRVISNKLIIDIETFYVRGDDKANDNRIVNVTKQEKELLERFEKYYNEKFSGDVYEVGNYIIDAYNKLQKIKRFFDRGECFECESGFNDLVLKIQRKATKSDLQQAVKDLFEETGYLIDNNGVLYKININNTILNNSIGKWEVGRVGSIDELDERQCLSFLNTSKPYKKQTKLKLLSVNEACFKLAKKELYIVEKEDANRFVSFKQNGQEFNLYLLDWKNNDKKSI